MRLDNSLKELHTFIVGIVRKSSLFPEDTNNGRRLCVVPFDVSWARSTALLGAVYNADRIRVRTEYDGIIFSTRTRG